MTAVLDSRVIRMTKWLIEQDEPRSTADLAADLGLTERVVRYRLGVVENFLRSKGATLSRRRGTGLLVEMTDAVRADIENDLADRIEVPRVYAPEEREHLLLAALLWASPDVTPLDKLNLDLEVSKTSARRDLHRCEPWLERNGVPLLRKPGRGVVVVGTERQVRRAMVQLLLEALPEDVLEELAVTEFAEARQVHVRIPSGLRDRLAELPLRACVEAVRSSVDDLGSLAGNSDVVLSLHLAITASRFNDGRRIQLDPGYRVSLMDHPAAVPADLLARKLSSAGVADLVEDEVASVTEYLLGLNALAAVKREHVDLSSLLDAVLDRASEELHPSLKEDVELRHGLALHLGRLAVRLRHGLPVHNPLLAEVAERYPDVYRVAEQAAVTLGDHFGDEVGEDEVGFITMYLSGALERANLRPRRQALVVCPSGMATAWVLVSRIQAEFPELAITEVLSARAFEDLPADGEADVVISTVPLEATQPVVVVSALLSQSDVARVTAALR
ncbi:MAG: PRD domain-containing protein [Acidimicrobiales bacterium]|nr:PRD domain-containing protein [Acidimicrobiales bacterium]